MIKKNVGKDNPAHYANAYAHLLDELRWLNRMIIAKVLYLRRVNFYEGIKNFRDLFINDEEIDELISNLIFEKEEFEENQKHFEQIKNLQNEAEKLRVKIEQQVIFTLNGKIFLPSTRWKFPRCFLFLQD